MTLTDEERWDRLSHYDDPVCDSCGSFTKRVCATCAQYICAACSRDHWNSDDEFTRKKCPGRVSGKVARLKAIRGS